MSFLASFGGCGEFFAAEIYNDRGEENAEREVIFGAGGRDGGVVGCGVILGGFGGFVGGGAGVIGV